MSAKICYSWPEVDWGITASSEISPVLLQMSSRKSFLLVKSFLERIHSAVATTLLVRWGNYFENWICGKTLPLRFEYLLRLPNCNLRKVNNRSKTSLLSGFNYLVYLVVSGCIPSVRVTEWMLFCFLLRLNEHMDEFVFEFMFVSLLRSLSKCLIIRTRNVILWNHKVVVPEVQ